MKKFNDTSISKQIKEPSHVADIQSLFKKILKIDIKPSNVYELVSGVLGFKDYNTAKAFKLISVRFNLSNSNRYPVWVRHEFGYYKNYLEIENEINAFINSSDKEGEYFIFEDDIEVLSHEKKSSSCDEGYVLEITVKGHTTSDLRDALNEVISSIDNSSGCCENDTSSYSFIKFGEEYISNSPVDNNTFINNRQTIIFDSKSVIKSANKGFCDDLYDEFDEIKKPNSNRDYEDYCVIARTVDGDVLNSDDEDKQFYLFNSRGKMLCHGDCEDIKYFISELINHEFILYLEIDRV